MLDIDDLEDLLDEPVRRPANHRSAKNDSIGARKSNTQKRDNFDLDGSDEDFGWGGPSSKPVTATNATTKPLTRG